MPGQSRIPTTAISMLLLALTAQPLQAASPSWSCRAAPDGASWLCAKGGVPDGGAAPTRSTAPAPSSVAPVRKPPALAAKKKRPKQVTGPARKPAPAASPRVAAPAVARLDRGLNWDRCATLPRRPVAKPDAGEAQPTYINADAAEISRDDEVGVFTGNVEVTRGNRLLSADEVRYDNKSDVVDAAGHVYYQDPTLRIEGSRARFSLGEDRGHVESAEYRLPESMARGVARRAERIDRNRAHFEEIEYTTCRPGDNSWVLRASTMETDQASGRGEATHARLLLGGLPFLYTPYFSFPLDDRRKSGLLTPAFGRSDNLGTDISLPYYLNLAPNYDATITPRIMSRRGLMLAGEFRYLTRSHSGIASGEIISNDKGASDRVDKRRRGAFSLKERGQLARNMVLDLDINHVSDKEYLDDFGGSLAISSVRQLQQRADLNYYGDDWSLLARLQSFQSADRTLTAGSEAYRRLPQIRFSLNRPDQPLGLTYQLNAEYVRFDHKTKVRGQRYDLLAGLSMPMTRSWGFLTPKVTARYTAYSLRHEAAGAEDSPDRFIPTLSVDSGLFFERDTNWFGTALVQTLEPRAFYLAIPYENQDDQPNFDTSRNDTTFPSLFRENRFNGTDRVGDANQLTLALTSRLLERESGRELLRASLGSILYFRDRKVQLSPSAAYEDDPTSELIAEGSMRLGEAWSGRIMGQWDPHRSSRNTTKAAAQLHYRDRQRRIFNIAHRYNRDVSEQTELSARWPVTRRLSLVGRWHYSLLYNSTMEGFGGFEYDGCCYIVRVLARHYVNGFDSDNANDAIFVQLELKGLSRFGSDIVSLLDRGIFGYGYDR